MRQPESRRLDPSRLKDGPLKEIAGRIAKLSYRDMQRFADLFDAKNEPGRSTAERLLAVADDLGGNDETTRFEHDGRGPG